MRWEKRCGSRKEEKERQRQGDRERKRHREMKRSRGRKTEAERHGGEWERQTGVCVCGGVVTLAREEHDPQDPH